VPAGRCSQRPSAGRVTRRPTRGDPRELDDRRDPEPPARRRARRPAGHRPRHRHRRRRRALPALLSGLDLELQSGKAEALGAAALNDHDPGLLEQANPLALVDTSDGEKILGHIFGDNRSVVEQRLGATSHGDSGIFSKLLPLLAPLIMSWLAGRLTKQAGTRSGEGGGGLGDLLGGLLGGGSSSGGEIGDLLGGILGGEKAAGKAAMPDLGGLFDLFGGGGDDEGGFDIGDLLKPRSRSDTRQTCCP
jgi:hypothetical protein